MKCPRVLFLNFTLSPSSVWKGYNGFPNYFPGYLYHLKISPATHEWSTFSEFSLAFGGITIFYLPHSDRGDITLMCISLLANDTEHIFMCLLSVYLLCWYPMYFVHQHKYKKETIPVKKRKDFRLWRETPLMSILALPLTGYVTLGNFLIFMSNRDVVVV